MNEGADANVACEVMDALGGLFSLVKRSATLDGSAPVKAVQFCTPFVQGNAAGFHLLFNDSVLLRQLRRGVALGFTDNLEAKVGGDGYAARVTALVARGVLPRDGFWHRKFTAGAYWMESGKLHLWTGLLVRPARGVWILATGAFNRRCSIDVVDQIIPDTGQFVPLVITLDLASTRKKDTFLEKELACLVPLLPEATFTSRTLAEAPELGQRYIDHFDDRWDSQGPGKYLGAYRKLTVKESAETSSGPASCRMVTVSGPNLHRFRTFDRFATLRGWSKDHPGKERLQFVEVRNIFHVRGLWNGDALRDLEGETPASVERLRHDWRAVYGDDGVERLNRFLVGYVRSTHGPRIGEPFLTFTPWVFIETPPGWSSFVDGFHFPGLDGMRGVVSTDKYHATFQVWQFTETGRFEIGRGAPLLRVLPVPRRLLQAGVRAVDLEVGPTPRARWRPEPTSVATTHIR
jgi:hypothetical protein